MQRQGAQEHEEHGSSCHGTPCGDRSMGSGIWLDISLSAPGVSCFADYLQANKEFLHCNSAS